MKSVIFALLLSAAVCMILGPLTIPLLKRLKFGQSERSDGPKSHLTKAGTPTMGGIMFLVSIPIAVFAFREASSSLAIAALLVTLACGLIGFLDDFLKVKFKNTVGLRGYQKIIAQFGVALVLALYAYNSPFIGSTLYMPFFDIEWDLGIMYIPFVMFVVIATVTSVHLTDGLDGLASGVSLVYAVTMAVIFLYLSAAALNPVDMGQASEIQYAAELGSMAVFAAAIAGGCMGFLKFNSYPARVFMGDTGSLALGGAISAMAIFSRSPLLLIIMGGCFVASSLSSILQVGSYKLRKKRIFKMAPLHHHFELLGHSETRIVSAYMITTVFLCLICLLAYV
ncbi:MAG: phospho-N-acetylmuramoyl-pentapeptide-transferase [Clostridia bacterium]|nr:phospho-N-acetylmuramoyl-pentapeptide-transferase [Clostridia bacterium]